MSDNATRYFPVERGIALERFADGPTRDRRRRDRGGSLLNALFASLALSFDPRSIRAIIKSDPPSNEREHGKLQLRLASRDTLVRARINGNAADAAFALGLFIKQFIAIKTPRAGGRAS